MSNLDPTPGTERRNVIFNLVMFTLTGLVTLIYSWTFVEHVLRGLETSLTDELLGCAIISSSVFYGRALAQSYKAYVRTYGPSFSIGPFTILNTSLLPSSSTTSVAPPTPMIIQREGTPRPTFSSLGYHSPKIRNDVDVDLEMDTPGMMFDTPRHSVDFALCPPTPDSIASNPTPILVTPSMDAVVGRSSSSSSSSSTMSTPSKAGQGKFRFALGGGGGGAGMRGGQGDDWEDMEKGEMFGLGMGDIGGGRGMEEDESRTVRP